MATGRACAAAMVMTGILVGVWHPTSAWAQDPIHKMGRGVVNVLTAWIEVPKQLQLGTQHADNMIAGVGRGLVKGMSMTLVRGGVGLYEALTFPIPIPKDFASPYERMQMDDYAWE